MSLSREVRRGQTESPWQDTLNFLKTHSKRYDDVA
jgi:hypothetical protein